MATGVVRLLFSLVGQDKLSAHISKSQKSLDGFANSADRAGSKSGQVFAKLNGVIEGMPGSITDLKSGFDLLGSAVGQVSQVVDTLAEGERRLNASRIFEQTQGGAEASKKAMDDFGEAVRGSLSTAEITDFANRMRFAGIEGETIGKTLETAFTISQAGGEDLISVADRLKDSLVTGSETGFELLGINRDLNTAFEEQAKKLGTTMDAMSTTEKAQLRLNVITKEAEKRAVELGFDVNRLGTSFQKFRSDVKDATDAAAEFAAAQFSTMRRTEEVKNLRNAVVGLTGEFSDLFETQAKDDKLAAALQRIGNITRDQARALVTEFRQDVPRVTESTFKILARRLQAVKDEEAAKSLAAKQKALKAERDAENKANKARAKSVVDLNKLILESNDLLTSQIINNQQAAAADTEATIKSLSLEIELMGGDVEGLTADQKRARLEAEQFSKDAQEAIRAAQERRAKEKERINRNVAAARAAADAREALTRRELRAEIETENIRDQMRIDNLKKNKEFDKAQELAQKMAARNQRITAAEDGKLLASERVARQVKLDQELFRIEEEFDRLRDQHKAERKAIENEEKQKERDDEKKHLDDIAEFRRKHREKDLRQAEDFASRAQALSGDLRRYDEETAIVMQGQADITGAIAQNAGNAAKQSAAAIAAGGRTTEALIKDNRTAAATRAAFETAAGFASLAAADPVGATMHFTAAGLFSALAATSGGAKKGSARGGTQTLSRGGGGAAVGFGGSNTGNNVTVNVAGFVSGTTKDLGLQLSNTIQGVDGTGLSTGTV
tara:strand:+ start:3389 stop:5752 length:2364 start_codon:yes stop_codon:yes gene_type:complete